MPIARNAIAEAADVLPDGHVGRVLEPSPPAVDEAPYFADDPLAADVGDGVVVAPVGGNVTWVDYVADHPEVAHWAARRWLTPHALPPAPSTLVATRRALHRLAAYVIAPARHAANGKFGLRYTLGGFGTPFFGDDTQIRVETDDEGTQLVVQEGSAVRSSAVTSLAAAAAFVATPVDGDLAAEDDSTPLGDVDEVLGIDAAAARFLGEWYGFAFATLEAFRHDELSVDASRVQLWPGHFDAAVEVGDPARRASYGASPGDDSSDEPYLYVSIWSPETSGFDASDPAWNARGFPGAVLPLSQLVGNDDPVSAGVAFYSSLRDRLGES